MSLTILTSLLPPLLVALTSGPGAHLVFPSNLLQVLLISTLKEPLGF